MRFKVLNINAVPLFSPIIIKPRGSTEKRPSVHDLFTVYLIITEKVVVIHPLSLSAIRMIVDSIKCRITASRLVGAVI